MMILTSDLSAVLDRCQKLFEKNSPSRTFHRDRATALLKGGEIEKKIMRLKEKADLCWKNYMVVSGRIASVDLPKSDVVFSKS